MVIKLDKSNESSIPGRLVGVHVGPCEGHVGRGRGGGVVYGSQVWRVGVSGGVAGPAGLQLSVGTSSSGQRNQDVSVSLGTIRVVLHQLRLDFEKLLVLVHLYIAGEKSRGNITEGVVALLREGGFVDGMLDKPGLNNVLCNNI